MKDNNETEGRMHKLLNLQIMTKDMFMLKRTNANKKFLELEWNKISKGHKFILYNPKENSMYSVDYIDERLT